MAVPEAASAAGASSGVQSASMSASNFIAILHSGSGAEP